MKPTTKNTLIGVGGGIFASVYSNAVRHEPILKRFPSFHLSVIAGGAIVGYLIGTYEEKALGRYDALVAKFKERRAGFMAADEE